MKGFTKEDLLKSKAGQMPENQLLINGQPPKSKETHTRMALIVDPEYEKAMKNMFVGEKFPPVEMQQGNIIQNLALNLTLQKSTDEQKLNKLETSWLAEMRRRNYEWIGVQNITLKLADDLRYNPDFSAKIGGDLVFFETKGFMRDDARGKLKMAARQFPLFRFVLVTKEKGQWIETPIKP